MNYQPVYDSILKIGSQELIPIGEHYRFSIKDVMPHTGYKFKFGLRDRVIKTMVERGKRLEVVFADHPDISFNMNPIEWLNKGEQKKQVGLFKNDPMTFYWYYVDFNGRIANRKEAKDQLTLTEFD